MGKPHGSVCLMKKTDIMDHGLFMSMRESRGGRRVSLSLHSDKMPALCPRSILIGYP